jgi:UDP-N-acetylglucosamine diphosphorylase / glucose-1-phosphate thymidylyltransferase / UDP-N-acetylgalactosamine diphosphorylase / glucosamine-1-phosphate N-acetyltransferase / galactosamine-1-phosphate N-acetyltransferase
MIRTAAILARGLGTRMRRDDATAKLDPGQDAAADTGMKGMIPIKRPFLEYVISALADAGISDVVLVLGPEHDAVRKHFTVDAPPQRVRIRFAEQAQPIGTANAVVAAADAIGDESFLVLNADNYYPVDAYAALAADESAGTIAFDRDALVALGNIDPERVRSFAVLDVTEEGFLAGIIEKPGESLDLSAESARWVGMNCWAVTPEIVSACRRVPKSARGEFELPEAVGLAIREGVAIRAIKMAAAVLDLSRRSDIAAVSARLESVEPRP